MISDNDMKSKMQTVLIVDDVATNVEVLDGVLGKEYEILFATSGKDAIELAAVELPDVILLDVVMPDMDGYEVCARLKSNAATRDIPVIFVTAMDNEEEESRGLTTGGIDYITKPIRPSIVRARVRNQLVLKRYRDILKELSTLDGLTGIANRRKFNESLEDEWRRARRALVPVSLLMMDIDFFKAYNDHYGHLAGDECLQRIAWILRGIGYRSADLPARYGGEEFALLLPETDAQGVLLVAKRLQERVKNANIAHAFSEAAGHVTLSIGAGTTIPSDSLSSSRLIECADACLYAAKQKGRNRIETGFVSP